MVVFGVVLALGVLLADLVASESSSAILSVHASHGSGAVVVAHSTIAIALALLGPPIVLAGLSLMHLQSLRSAKVLSLVAGLTLLYADGLVHWLAVLEHLGEPLYAAFFIVGGAVQVGAVLLVRRRERALWWLGVAFTVFFIELYVLVLVVPAPFSVEPESLTSLGTLSKGFELALLASLGIFYGPRMVPTRLRKAVVHGPSLALLFLGALASLITIDVERYWYWWPRLVFLPDTAGDRPRRFRYPRLLSPHGAAGRADLEHGGDDHNFARPLRCILCWCRIDFSSLTLHCERSSPSSIHAQIQR